MLETRTRFKEDCDCRNRSGRSLVSRLASVGNQDSLQRGLRPNLCEEGVISFPGTTVGNQDSLQRGLRPCPHGAKGLKNLLHVGNQDSLQRGLRPEYKCSSISENVNVVGNQDSLQRGLRRTGSSVLTISTSIICWKPGLASKRIATAVPFAAPTPLRGF